VPATNADPAVATNYRIGIDDVLQISVYKEPDASVPEVVVRSDGKISLPLVKEVEAANLTPLELEVILTEKLGKLIHGAEVTVLVKQVNSKKVYVIGQVRTPGAIRWRASLTVLKALGDVGGLSDYAKKKKIYVLRNENGVQKRLPFNYETVIKGEHMEQNIPLLPEDTIVIP
jgi:polysaccharide export outer membrane protein